MKLELFLHRKLEIEWLTSNAPPVEILWLNRTVWTCGIQCMDAGSMAVNSTLCYKLVKPSLWHQGRKPFYISPVTTQVIVVSKRTLISMELAIRVNVRYVAPPDSKIQDALQLFRSPSWVQFIIRYIMPQLNNASPASASLLSNLDKMVSCQSRGKHCVICMDKIKKKGVELPCGHVYHENCVVPWLKLHSTCPTCRFQLPTDAGSIYSVHAINTTIVLQQAQASIPTEQLLNLPAGNQTIQAVVSARVRRNPNSTVVTSSTPEMDVQVPGLRRSRRCRQQQRRTDESAASSLDTMLVSAVESRQAKRARTTRRDRRLANRVGLH